MAIESESKACVILLNMGGPGSLEEVGDYLYRIFCDRSIIQLPGGRIFQKPFARMISRMRRQKVQDRYKLIGGSSPQLKWTRSQANGLAQELENDFGDFCVYIGMRYSEPSIERAIASALEDGYRSVVVCPLYPHYSLATTESSFLVVDEALSGIADVECVKIRDFHDDPAYIQLLRDVIAEEVSESDTILFSAHSIPESLVERGDPYVDQVYKTAQMVCEGREYYVSFQSRTGPVKWVGPDTLEETRRLLSDKSADLMIVPISFVSDHIETLYEIDIELKEIVGPELGGRIKRMSMFNDDPRFGRVLAGLVKGAFHDYVVQ